MTRTQQVTPKSVIRAVSGIVGDLAKEVNAIREHVGPVSGEGTLKTVGQVIGQTAKEINGRIDQVEFMVQEEVGSTIALARTELNGIVAKSHTDVAGIKDEIVDDLDVKIREAQNQTLALKGFTPERMERHLRAQYQRAQAELSVGYAHYSQLGEKAGNDFDVVWRGLLCAEGKDITRFVPGKDTTDMMDKAVAILERRMTDVENASLDMAAGLKTFCDVPHPKSMEDEPPVSNHDVIYHGLRALAESVAGLVSYGFTGPDDDFFTVKESFVEQITSLNRRMDRMRSLIGFTYTAVRKRNSLPTQKGWFNPIRASMRADGYGSHASSATARVAVSGLFNY